MRLLTFISAILLVLMPAAAQEQTVAATLAANPDFSTLVTLVATADLIGVLDDPGAELTVFAPDNAAFSALPQEAVDALLADTELLTRVLAYHVIEGRYMVSDLANLSAVASMEADGSELTFVGTEDGLVVNGVLVTEPNIEVSNGSIHMIGSVLFPPDVARELILADLIQVTPEPTLYGTLNPAGLENDQAFNAVAELTAPLTALNGFENIASVESLALDSAGNAYVTVDLAINEDNAVTEGGLLVYGGYALGEVSEPRLIAGPETGIISPKGLQVLETLGVVAIADNGARDVKLFAVDAEGDTAPAAVLSIGETGGVWDVWYDIINDTLYAAKTNGELVAYDAFSETMGADGPDRVIIPTDIDGNRISVNLHGIEIDYDSNTVILTDVGDAANNADGQIFTISLISISDGPTPVDARIFGDETKLGNPVDVIFDGSGIYVAEKANDVVLYYGNILGLMDDLNVPADAEQPGLKAESVAIFPTRESAFLTDMGLESE